jgi:hypothetical protein
MQGQPPLQQGECNLADMLGNELGLTSLLSSSSHVSEVADDVVLQT